MRDDQIERLKTLSEKLADVVMEEADPDTWPGAGQPIAEMTQQDRGDRYWSKKNAAATFALLARAESMIADASAIAPNGQPYDRPEMDEELDKAEKVAAKALERARARSSGLVKHSKAGG